MSVKFDNSPSWPSGSFIAVSSSCAKLSDVMFESFAFSPVLTGFSILGFDLGILLMLATQIKKKKKQSQVKGLQSVLDIQFVVTFLFNFLFQKQSFNNTFSCRSKTFNYASSDVNAGVLNPGVLQETTEMGQANGENCHINLRGYLKVLKENGLESLDIIQ